LPASVSKNHWPSFFTTGIGNGQDFHPLPARTWNPIRARSGCLVECGGERIQFVRGLHPIRVRDVRRGRAENVVQGIGVCALAAATSALTAASGVAKVLPVSAALMARGAAKASAKTKRRWTADERTALAESWKNFWMMFSYCSKNVEFKIIGDHQSVLRQNCAAAGSAAIAGIPRAGTVAQPPNALPGSRGWAERLKAGLESFGDGLGRLIVGVRAADRVAGVALETPARDSRLRAEPGRQANRSCATGSGPAAHFCAGRLTLLIVLWLMFTLRLMSMSTSL